MEHLQQIQQAIDFIEGNLENDLSSDSIAQVAGFSKWHFQMIFSSAVGDSLKEYIRKRRLSAAASALGETNKKIIAIAMDAGFESQESFSRAFKQMFGKNPGECRKEGIKSVMSLRKPKVTMEYLDHLYKGINMQPLIKQTHEMKIVGMGSKFISTLSPDHDNLNVIPALWGKYVPRSHEIINRLSWVDVGVCFDPGKEKSHPDECFYIAGTEVKNFEQIPEGMMSMTIPAGKYAVFTHKGTIQKLPMTMKYIYGSWLPKSGEKLRDAPDLEIYDQRFKADSEISELDIYIPLY